MSCDLKPPGIPFLTDKPTCVMYMQIHLEPLQLQGACIGATQMLGLLGMDMLILRHVCLSGRCCGRFDERKKNGLVKKWYLLNIKSITPGYLCYSPPFYPVTVNATNAFSPIELP